MPMLTESIKKEFTEHVPSKSFERWQKMWEYIMRNTMGKGMEAWRGTCEKVLSWGGYIWEENDPGEE